MPAAHPERAGTPQALSMIEGPNSPSTPVSRNQPTSVL